MSKDISNNSDEKLLAGFADRASMYCHYIYAPLGADPFDIEECRGIALDFKDELLKRMTLSEIKERVPKYFEDEDKIMIPEVFKHFLGESR